VAVAVAVAVAVGNGVPPGVAVGVAVAVAVGVGVGVAPTHGKGANATPRKAVFVLAAAKLADRLPLMFWLYPLLSVRLKRFPVVVVYRLTVVPVTCPVRPSGAAGIVTELFNVQFPETSEYFEMAGDPDV
jgi:hypothetical protein